MRRRFMFNVGPQAAPCGPGVHAMHGHGPWGPEFGPHGGLGGGRGGFGGGRGGFGPGGRRKRARGDIRAAILALLAEAPMHGYQIIGEIAERSEDAWRPSAGSVYPTLQQLTDEGLVRSSEADGRRVYELTDTGRAAAESREGPAPWEQAADEDGNPHRELRRLAGGLLQAVAQVTHSGTPEQVSAAHEVLREARKRIYRLLADAE